MDNQEFEDLKWSSHYLVESAPSDLNDGDKIILPPSVLEQLLLKVGNTGNLPSPLTFELRHPHSNSTIHCGVKEFSSSGNTTQLPTWIMSALGLQLGDHVLIKLAILPKGTWTSLQPVSADYRQIADYRAALEAHLRGHYNTLTKGQVLSCRYGGRTYQFKVLDLKPRDAVSVTDTDLEVDIKHDELKNDVQNDISVVQVNDAISHIDIPSGYKYWKLALNDHHNITINLTVETGDADIVVCSTEKTPTLENHEWSDFSSDNQRAINLLNLKSTHLHVGIYAYDNDTTVSWQAVPFTESIQMDEQQDNAGKEQCKNCLAWVLQRTLILHENFCLRNNLLCPWGCNKVFKKDSQELKDHWHCDQCDHVAENGRQKHINHYHTLKKCTCTHFTTDSYEALAEHARTTCPDKLIICRYCHIPTAQGVMSLDSRDRLLGLHSHESYCGSRTITCQKCSKPIPIKDIQIHAKIHEVKRQQQTLPPMCCNRNCIRPKAKNRLSFCQYCFGPFWITEDDPKNVKLIQRVARRLHSQLTVGCGNEWCRNKYCASFTKDPKDATTAASVLIPMIKSLPRQLAMPNPTPELYFCVDETTTRKKFLAELLVSESDGKYEIGWCVKAIENEQEDLDRAKAWLNSNAPHT